MRLPSASVTVRGGVAGTVSSGSTSTGGLVPSRQAIAARAKRSGAAQRGRGGFDGMATLLPRVDGRGDRAIRLAELRAAHGCGPAPDSHRVPPSPAGSRSSHRSLPLADVLEGQSLAERALARKPGSLLAREPGEEAPLQAFGLGLRRRPGLAVAGAQEVLEDRFL